MRKLIPFGILIAAMAILFGAARTSSSRVQMGNTDAALDAVMPSPNAFVLKQSYPLSIANREMLASVYTSNQGRQQKEILSIWSKESHGYELQYIRTTPTGQQFLEPEVVSMKRSRLINIFTRDAHSGSVLRRATLLLASDSTLKEVQPSRQGG